MIVGISYRPPIPTSRFQIKLEERFMTFTHIK